MKKEDVIFNYLKAPQGRLNYNEVVIEGTRLIINLEWYDNGNQTYVGKVVKRYNSYEDIPMCWTWKIGDCEIDEFGNEKYEVIIEEDKKHNKLDFMASCYDFDVVRGAFSPVALFDSVGEKYSFETEEEAIDFLKNIVDNK